MCITISRRLATLFTALLTTVLMAGCASPIAAVGSAANVALQIAGLKKEEDEKPRQIRLELQAGANLNADDRGRPLAAVVRIYQLKDTGAFWQAPYDAFVQPDRDQALLGSSIIDVQELTFAPGQTYSMTATVPREAKAIAIVALFHTPAPQRWRVAFDPEASEKSGILVGIHSCAMTATRGSVLSAQASGQASLQPPTWNSLLGVQCGGLR